jgi:hypothetical protein
MREEEGEEAGRRKDSNSKTRSDRETGENKKQPLADHHTAAHTTYLKDRRSSMSNTCVLIRASISRTLLPQPRAFNPIARLGTFGWKEALSRT